MGHLRFITNNINHVTSLAENIKRPQTFTFTKNRQNKLSHVTEKLKKMSEFSQEASI